MLGGSQGNNYQKPELDEKSSNNLTSSLCRDSSVRNYASRRQTYVASVHNLSRCGVRVLTPREPPQARRVAGQASPGKFIDVAVDGTFDTSRRGGTAAKRECKSFGFAARSLHLHSQVLAAVPPPRSSAHFVGMALDAGCHVGVVGSAPSALYALSRSILSHLLLAYVRTNFPRT